MFFLFFFFFFFFFLWFFFFFSSRRRHTRSDREWSSDVCSSDLRDGGDRQRQLPADAAQAQEDVRRRGHRLQQGPAALLRVAAIDRVCQDDPQQRIALGPQRRAQERKVLLVGRGGQGRVSRDPRLQL